jgi:hypothetical protein
MFPRNIARLTASIIEKSPYTFDVVWARSNYMLIEMNGNYPQGGEAAPDHDLKSVSFENDKTAEVFEIREIKMPMVKESRHEFLQRRIDYHMALQQKQAEAKYLSMFNTDSHIEDSVVKDRLDWRYL